MRGNNSLVLPTLLRLLSARAVHLVEGVKGTGTHVAQQCVVHFLPFTRRGRPSLVVPNYLIQQILFVKHLVHDQLGVMATMPIQMNANRTIFVEEFVEKNYGLIKPIVCLLYT